MRPGLRWLLAVTASLSAVALWGPDNTSDKIVSAVQRAPSEVDPPRQIFTSQVAPGTPTEPLPMHLAKASLLDKPRFDPFGMAKLPETPKLKSPIDLTNASPPPPPQPQPPALNYRYLGQMISPDGERIVYLARANSEIQVRVGTKLEGGYVVQMITGKAIDLYYPALSVKVTIPIPSVQESTAPP